MIAYTLHGQDWRWIDGSVLPTTPQDRPCFARWAKLATDIFAKEEVKPLAVENAGTLEDVGGALDRLMNAQNKEKMVITVA